MFTHTPTYTPHVASFARQLRKGLSKWQETIKKETIKGETIKRRGDYRGVKIKEERLQEERLRKFELSHLVSLVVRVFVRVGRTEHLLVLPAFASLSSTDYSTQN